MLFFAILFITLALIFYTLGVFGEKLQKTLKSWHLAAFWAGFACDTTGTALMIRLAGGQNSISFHTVTGIAAIVLMLIHTIWATVVFKQKNDIVMAKFHKFSVIVWLIWLIPYFSGMFAHMIR
ncbi:HsmA family protein [Clostridium sp. E02]|uniref:HsmA family protein n=1 Tax=Clostridium sp. E02 TaxID=2487134 RepID=UPI000F520D18|nr:HsmA family protein [Clostridium sp. E02]